MKQVLINTRTGLEKMLDALDLTEQWYTVEKIFLSKETGLSTTSEITPAWQITFGDAPPEQEEEKEAIGFRLNNYEENDEIEDEEDF